MLRYFFLFILVLHGLLHILGFLKAFQIGDIDQLTKEIARPLGLLWLLCALLFIGTALLFISQSSIWPALGFIAIALSQLLITIAWADAKWGTIANILILLVAIVGYESVNFEYQFRRDVQKAATAIPATDLITTQDLAHLPTPVQRYLDYAGVVGQPKVRNMRVVMEGRMREKGKDWFTMTTEQYNFFDAPTRLFFMKAAINGVPAWGYHAYKDQEAAMTVKVLSTFPVVKIDGDTLFRAETVTFFNDLCIMAPAALIDPTITWEPIDDFSAKAAYNNQGVTIHATLHFNAKGQLVNFISDDRYDISKNDRIRFSTPMGNYRQFGAMELPGYGEAVWHYEDGPFVYGEFNIKSIEYNVSIEKIDGKWKTPQS